MAFENHVVRSSNTRKRTGKTHCTLPCDSSEEESDTEYSDCEDNLQQVCVSYIKSDDLSYAHNNQTPQSASFYMRRKLYWRINFGIVLAPFICCGIPIHLLIFGKHGIKSTKEWLKFIFLKDKPQLKVILLTLPFALVGLAFYGYFIYMVLKFLNQLIIKGQFGLNFFSELVHIIQVVPVGVPITVVWFLGYAVKNLLYSFDRLQCPIVFLGKDETEMMKRWNRHPPYRLYLGAMYGLGLIYEVIQILLISEDLHQKFPDGMTSKSVNDNITRAWLDFFVSLMYNLMLPVYITFALAIQFEFRLLTLHIKDLIRQRVVPVAEHFDDIKQYYKSIGSRILLVNDISNLYFSWTLFVLVGQLQNETLDTVVSILQRIIESDSEAAEKDVRLFVGNLACLIFQILIIYLTIWFAIDTNDMARDIQVRLNDFVSQRNVVLSPELYRKFRMLKYYIHSRMETEKPTLLSLAVVKLFPFGLYSWMTNYNVRH